MYPLQNRSLQFVIPIPICGYKFSLLKADRENMLLQEQDMYKVQNRYPNITVVILQMEPPDE